MLIDIRKQEIEKNIESIKKYEGKTINLTCSMFNRINIMKNSCLKSVVLFLKIYTWIIVNFDRNIWRTRKENS